MRCGSTRKYDWFDIRWSVRLGPSPASKMPFIWVGGYIWDGHQMNGKHQAEPKETKRKPVRYGRLCFAWRGSFEEAGALNQIKRVDPCLEPMSNMTLSTPPLTLLGIFRYRPWGPLASQKARICVRQQRVFRIPWRIVWPRWKLP